jgi:hypothetical protein
MLPRLKSLMSDSNQSADRTCGSGTPLSYAPAAPSRRWRRWTRRAIILLVLTAVAAGIRWGPTYLARAQVLYWQRRCLRYSPPDDLVVYEQGGSAQARIAAGGGFVAAGMRTLAAAQPGTRPASLPPSAAYAPDCWRQYVRACTAPGVAAWIAPASGRRVAFGMRGASTPAALTGVLFLHERTSPSGARRLVVVLSDFMTDTRPKFIVGYDVDAFAHGQATWSQPPTEDVCCWDIDVIDSVYPTPPHVRVFAGQVDAADSTHFTIRYEIDGVAKVVDGYLQDGPVAGSTAVVLTPRP